ncbi:MAG: bifunctional phosphoribosylaminoimidazolecarboxamide formyltransferase/IMP cyclohydrolase [Pseudomonadota bacterium]
MTDRLQPRRALISVSDKSGLETLAQALKPLDIEVLSTGGTAKTLAGFGLQVKEVADHTGFPEMMDGRVKTLHPKIHGGLLALRGNADHEAAMDAHDIGGIDLLIVNLYPFEATVERGAAWDEVIENIDIGGPAMIRSAAKNHAHVAVVTDPADYQSVIDDLAQGGLTCELRRTLAAKAFARTSGYDSAIAAYFNDALGTQLPERLTVGGQRGDLLRYGENPHQAAAFYASPGASGPSVAGASQVQGKALSFNNLNDTDAAFALVSDLGADLPADQAAVAIIKHANPCGVAIGASVAEAYQKAFECDQVSAFGGIIAASHAIDGPAAEAITSVFTEVVIAPDADGDARTIFAKKKNLRLLLTSGLADPAQAGLNVRSLSGGLLVQGTDTGRVGESDVKVVTKRAPSPSEMADMILAFRIAKHVKSNAIIYVKDGATVGVGAGQMSRVDSSRIAARKAVDAAEALKLDTPRTAGSVVASDAFFPFADGLLAAAEAGASAVIQPGGSMRDDEVIAAADEAGLAMVFTGMRHFRH